MTKGTSKESQMIFEAYSRSVITQESINAHGIEDARALSKAADDYLGNVQQPVNALIGNGKVNIDSLVVQGASGRDRPKFTDAFFSYGEFIDGAEMSSDDLEEFQSNNEDLLNSMAHELTADEDWDNSADYARDLDR